MKWRIEKYGGADEGRQPLKFGSAGSPRVACPTSVPERLELYGEARPKPPTLRRRAPKTTKNPSGGWGRAFWPESGSLISVSKSIPPPVLRVPKIGKKRRFDAFFGRFFAFRKAQNAVNYSIFAFYRLLRELCKNAENAVNTNTFWTRDAQNTANTSVFESAAKNTVNYSMFGGLIAKNAGIHRVFAISRKRGRHETL